MTGPIPRPECVCVCVSLSVIRCNNDPLHLQSKLNEVKTKKEEQEQ